MTMLLVRYVFFYLLGVCSSPFLLHISSLGKYVVGCTDEPGNALGGTQTTAKETLPLLLFPLVKELRAGWGNEQVPPLIKRNASNARALVIDVGLDRGNEFFHSIDNGFEVVGFEPNPHSFQILATKCEEHEKCKVLDLVNTPLPLVREKSMSYLVNAGLGNSRSELTLSLEGPGTSFVESDAFTYSEKVIVPVYRLDEVVMEDVFILKIDTQGFDHYVLEGASKLFREFVVRQLIFEVEPLGMSKLGLDIKMTLMMLQDYGMICFPDRNDNYPFCDYTGDTADGFNNLFFGTEFKAEPTYGRWALCWEDFLCINIRKVYPGVIPPLL